MVDSERFIDALQASGIHFVTGVPDSLLKDVCACMTSRLPGHYHVIATSEGAAVGLAIGHYLATGRPALVYMQNAGLGNIVNPLTSLADSQVYGIPMILMIGWRGEIAADGSQLKDEPQHVKQGRITPAQLELLGVPFRVIDSQVDDINLIIGELRDVSERQSCPVALLVRKNTFAPFELASQHEISALGRELALKTLLECLPEDSPVIATTGMISRELFELRQSLNQGHERDFLTVGGMGHASQIAAGIALARPEKSVLCFDGDGALLMHAGSLAVSACCPNLIHVVLNNGAHDSVGGQPTRAAELRLSEVARAAGYKHVRTVDTTPAISDAIAKMIVGRQSSFLEIRCRRGSRKDLGRPDISPMESKQAFMRFLGKTSP